MPLLYFGVWCLAVVLWIWRSFNYCSLINLNDCFIQLFFSSLRMKLRRPSMPSEKSYRRKSVTLTLVPVSCRTPWLNSRATFTLNSATTLTWSLRRSRCHGESPLGSDKVNFLVIRFYVTKWKICHGLQVNIKRVAILSQGRLQGKVKTDVILHGMFLLSYPWFTCIDIVFRCPGVRNNVLIIDL